MSALPVVVLKFGGSVLGADADAARITHEIYRWVRTGHRVVAVVSALEGQTDGLLARAARWTAGAASASPASASAAAALVATGEQQSAALLGLALDRAGIAAEVLDQAAIGLRTTGPAQDATPVELDASAVLAALDRVPVVVTPGFTGRDAQGRVTLLGRGGSDLSALFIAHGLDAALEARGVGRLHDGPFGAAPRVRCRLVKDVDGLYDRDPAQHRATARRFAALSWDEALKLDGTIVQHKGVRFARSNRLEFEVAGLLGARASRVGDFETSFDEPARVPATPLRITILGAGTVGAGVYHAARQLPAWFEVVAVGTRTPERAAERGIDRALLTADLNAALQRDTDVVVELIGGLDPARDVIKNALRRGRRVVTANKAIIADAGRSARSLTRDEADAVACSAAVGGAVPCLEHAAQLAATQGVDAIAGVLNGTTNFVLGRVREGDGFEAAVRGAQEAGFAEADPSRDLDGRDAADKLAVLARAAFGVELDPDAVERVAIDAAACALAPPRAGVVLKHLARVSRRPDGSLAASVRPEWVEAQSAIGAASNEGNAVEFTTRTGDTVRVCGKGAGRWPTTQAVIADLFDLALRSIEVGQPGQSPSRAEAAEAVGDAGAIDQGLPARAARARKPAVATV